MKTIIEREVEKPSRPIYTGASARKMEFKIKQKYAREDRQYDKEAKRESKKEEDEKKKAKQKREKIYRKIEKLLKQRVVTKRVFRPSKQLVVNMKQEEDDMPLYFKQELDTAKREMFFR